MPLLLLALKDSGLYSVRVAEGCAQRGGALLPWQEDSRRLPAALHGAPQHKQEAGCRVCMAPSGRSSAVESDSSRAGTRLPQQVLEVGWAGGPQAVCLAAEGHDPIPAGRAWQASRETLCAGHLSPPSWRETRHFPAFLTSLGAAAFSSPH